MKVTAITTCECGHVITPTRVKSGAKAFTRCECGKLVELDFSAKPIMRTMIIDGSRTVGDTWRKK